ncbi:MAG: zinc-ribbon domain-containing protein [Deltaproteobacteria bacterium]|nr:zinc-ribbon domain-containing protein [Deltaproteobacteria bacterium]
MAACPKCNQQVQDNSAFCSSCGATLGGAPPPLLSSPVSLPDLQGQQSPVNPKAAAARMKSKPKVAPIMGLAISVAIAICAGIFMFMGKGCSSTKGVFVSQGAPLGNFTFTPKQCRSGQRMSMHGAVILGEGPTSGAVVVFRDPTKGELVKVEVPGSCRPPDYEICTEIIVDRQYCATYEISIQRTNTEVNRIRLIDGYLRLGCRFPQGGTISASIDFTNCD